MSQWNQIFDPRPDAELRLYCLPCAGGGASMYRSWPAHLPDWVELRAVRLPGRQGRHREPSFTDCDEAAAAVVEALAPELVGSFAFFGHSMGAMIGYRMTRLLERRGATLPTLLGFASWPPFGVAPAGMPDPDDPDERFVADLRRIGGVPAGMLDDPELLRLSLPVVRADFRLCRSYRYRTEPPLAVPVAGFGGVDDPVTPPAGIHAWRQHTRRFLGLRLYPGGHFFLNDSVPELVRSLVGELEQVSNREAAS